jgi:hypothetical protein
MNRCLNGILRLCAKEHTRIPIPQLFGMVEHAGKKPAEKEMGQINRNSSVHQI